jgi:glycerol-1-phosphatase
MALADAYDCFLFDLDGVLLRGEAAIAHAPAALRGLRERGKRLAFMTNNSSRTSREVAERLRRAGFEAWENEIATSAVATAQLLARDRVASAFVVGERGIREALSEAGISVVDGDPDVVDAVVVGWDRAADYAKLRRASLLVERGARLVATNGDRSYPAEDGRWPGAGALLSVVTVTTGVDAEVVGKPRPALFHAARERVGGGRPLVVGDRMDTDVAGAAALGWDSLLVLTGISSRTDAEASDVRPTYIGEDLTVLERDPRSAASG